MRTFCLFLSTALAGALLAAAAPKPAGATFPGTNGKIAFTAIENNKPQIWTMNHTGSSKTRITDPPRKNAHPVFFANGQRVVFTRTTANGVAQIFTMTREGNALTQITTGKRDWMEPAINHTNSKIVASREANNGYQNLFIMDADGTSITRFTSKKADDHNAEFSPDGNWVLFQRDLPNGNTRIVKRRADESAQMFLTEGNTVDIDPNWRSDGLVIVYTHVHGTQAIGRIHTMNSDGTGKTRLTDNGKNAFFANPVFSPDSTKIAYLRLKPGTNQPADIYKMNADGTGRERLTDANFFVTNLDWGIA